MGFLNKRTYSSKAISFIGLAAAFSSNTWAAEFALNDDWNLDVDTTVGVSVAQRLKDPDPRILAGGGDPVLGINSDDGNRSFAKDDLFQKLLSINVDADLNYQGQYGAFIRGRAWKDYAYSGSTSHDSFPTCNSISCSEYSDAVGDYHESRAEILDAFVYGTFQLADKDLSLRLGNQALSWGESLFLYGGISSAQGPIDVTKTNTPGVALKEVFLPVGQLSAQLSVTDRLSVSGYYQYDWEKSRVDAPGSYFSPTDIFGNGVSSLLLPVPPPAPPGTLAPVPYSSEEPDSGHFGVGVQYSSEAWSDTEFGVYLLKYNDTLPVIEADLSLLAAGMDLYPTVLNNLTHRYFEDIHLLGFSVGGVIGDTNVGAELSIRDGAPVQLKTPLGFFFAEGKTAQFQVSATHVFGSTPFADNITFLGEVGVNRVLSHDSVTSSVPGLDLAELDNDRSAWGFAGKLELDYFRILPKTDMTLTLSYKNDVNGASSVPFSFAQGNSVLGVATDFTYNNNLSYGFSYTKYLTDIEDVINELGVLEIGHLLADRDYVGGYVKYTF